MNSNPLPSPPRRGAGRAVTWLLLAALGAVFLVSACMVAFLLLRSARESAGFEELAQQVHQTQNAQESPYDENGMLKRYAGLYAQNPDLYGWLTIPDTRVDYPVVNTPDDPEYYLRRDFNGEKAQSGVPFVGSGCSVENGNLLIYGHNMNDGTMFRDILQYARQDFGLEHRTLLFDSLYQQWEFELVGAFYEEADLAPDQDAFAYYLYTDLTDPEVFDAYVSRVKEHSLYDTGVTPRHGQLLLTLSTCSYHDANGRFVVVASQVLP